jgi:hypothetical protein
MITMSRKEEIVVCKICKGRGIIYKSELADYHKGTYTTHSRDCTHCDKRGVVKRITSIEEKPLHQQEYSPCQMHNGEFKYDRNDTQ